MEKDFISYGHVQQQSDDDFDVDTDDVADALGIDPEDYDSFSDYDDYSDWFDDDDSSDSEDDDSSDSKGDDTKHRR
ncbi:hypothetical protein PC110_g20667 [Phytophthora cactorum]|uniref:Uncharacterized protein n=1 Tax=Phytophthora cactorum TaxID=29920 RepID=A0A329REG1_9STRA|nr:hypothetical protein PC110_g20667 [Phytophthora cactorum]